MEILRTENLSFKYPLCDKNSIENISVSIGAGEFVVVCGATGSGKSTFLRLLKRELIPLGEKSGEVFYKGVPLDSLDAKTSACAVGFVSQRPEQQIVCDLVWHELAFGLENMGVPQNEIRRRVAEMSSYFGIESWFDKKVSELSGGQKQLLNLASVMVMQPEILILDEPTAQLDPIAASDFISTVAKLNREFSLTVLLVEHRLEDAIPICGRLLVMDGGKAIEFGPPKIIAPRLRGKPKLLLAMPAAVRLCCGLPNRPENKKEDESCPLTIREGRDFILERFDLSVKMPETAEYVHSTDKALEFRDVFFRYARDGEDILHGTDFTVYSGELFCVLGGNGSGKTTTLSCAAGLYKPYSGSIRVFDRKLGDYKNQSLYRDCLALLPQDVQTVFLCNTVREELAEMSSEPALTLPYDLSPLYDKHPYDLSGGEQQLVALAKVLACRPKLLLLDEPTKGLDAYAKAGLAEILKKLKASGVTIVCVTHDVEFAAGCSDRCALFFRGEIVSCDAPRAFFSGNSFYTTAANRMTRGIFDGAVSVDDILGLYSAGGSR